LSDVQDVIGEDYIRLGFQIDQVLKEAKGNDLIIVDNYFGPPELQSQNDSIDVDELRKALKILVARVRKQVTEEPRRTFLRKQIAAMDLLVRFALDDKISFRKRVETGLDVNVVTVSSERIEELTEVASRSLSQKVLKGDLTSMATRWRKRAMTTGSEIISLAEELASTARHATQRLLFVLPESESVEFRAVPDAPWSAYNYYQGEYHSLIEINIKLPHSKYDVWGWITHETYPGHHTQLLQQELGYQQGTHNLEASMAIINTPECTIAEGLAETGIDLLAADRPLTTPEIIAYQLKQLRRAVAINALVMLHEKQRSESEVIAYIQEMGAFEHEYAKARLPFMTDPMWAPYGFTYFMGAWLVKGFFKATQEADQVEEFIKALYHELHTPTTLKSRLQTLGLKLPKQLI
jgi:hypothetical protein